MAATLWALNKPFGVLSQFTDREGRPTLADYLDMPDAYPAGRLDRDSEGLLLVTTDGKLQARIANPRHRLLKRYWVQVEGLPSTAAVGALRSGVKLRDGLTAPAEVSVLGGKPPGLWKRDPPIRVRATIPTRWLELGIREGRNRQVRRMTAAVGLPTLRLIRCAVGPWTLGDLAPGEVRELDPSDLRAKDGGSA